MSEPEFDRQLEAAVQELPPEHLTIRATLSCMSRLPMAAASSDLAIQSLVDCGPSSSIHREIRGEKVYERPDIDSALQQLAQRTRFAVLTGRPDSGKSISVPSAVMKESERVSYTCLGHTGLSPGIIKGNCISSTSTV